MDNSLKTGRQFIKLYFRNTVKNNNHINDLDKPSTSTIKSKSISVEVSTKHHKVTFKVAHDHGGEKPDALTGKQLFIKLSSKDDRSSTAIIMGEMLAV